MQRPEDLKEVFRVTGNKETIIVYRVQKKRERDLRGFW
jgi:hypothetical protein